MAMPSANWELRLAATRDVAALESLIAMSVRALQAPYYSSAQREAALGPVFCVDPRLISDGTYFVADAGGVIVGCGGWSRRKALHGGDWTKPGEDALLDPEREPARVRAFFVHPAWARRGIGRAILARSERELKSAGFRTAELVATLAGEPLYASGGYTAVERYELPMVNGLALPVVRMAKRFC